MSDPLRPAFYALRPGGWRDYVTLLHPPYTAWHLSYVAIGAALAPHVETWPLVGALGAFGLALGVGAHALDEFQGRPLGTRIPGPVLVALAAVSIGGAVAIGIVSALAFTFWLLPFVAVGGLLVVAYNLELAGGRFHSDAWFAVSWGGLPVISAYLAQTGRVDAPAVLAAGFAVLLSAAQRVLSTEVRELRRGAVPVEGAAVLAGGQGVELDRDSALRGREAALRALAAAVVLLAAALLVLRLA